MHKYAFLKGMIFFLIFVVSKQLAPDVLNFSISFLFPELQHEIDLENAKAELRGLQAASAGQPSPSTTGGAHDFVIFFFVWLVIL